MFFVLIFVAGEGQLIIKTIAYPPPPPPIAYARIIIHIGATENSTPSLFKPLTPTKSTKSPFSNLRQRLFQALLPIWCNVL